MGDGFGFGQVLTKRELEICKMIAKGMSSDRIAKLLFLSEGTVKNHLTTIYQKTGIQNRAQLAAKYAVDYAYVNTDVDPPPKTAPAAQPDAVLRLVGSAELPEEITIAHSGQPFVIGRFDASVGHKQCDFEFDKATKAVSRRHASISRNSRGWSVTDLGSTAGTFVNGAPAPSGDPYPLRPGDRISFGTAGADYVFEVV